MSKKVLITGATKGIGRELTKIFAQNGYALILVARNISELTTLQSELQSQYQCEVKILAVDLSQPDAVDNIMTTFKDDMPTLDTLINNAGFGIAKKLTNTSEEDVDGMIMVNIHALTKLTYHILPFMVRNKSGKILNVASTAAYSPGPYMAIYYASKAYVLTFTESLYEEYKEDGITISALCPGITKTSFQSRAGLENSPMLKGFLPIMTPAQVATIAYHGLMKKKRVIITGFFNKLSVFFMWLTPNFINAKITARLEKPKE